MSGVDGLLLLRKPPGITSFRALSPIKNMLPRTTKVGHTGTLDRFADGLLLVVCGRMTRLTPLLTGLQKEYVGEIRFGEETTTLDPEGEVVARGPAPELSQISDAASGFLGTIEQVPPQFSAVHVGGERAYRAARAGREVTIAPRKVTIESFDILDYSPPVAQVRVVCSSGTYIRSLARDVGRACGTFAFLSRLQRRRIGPFELQEAVAPEEFLPDRDLRSWRACLSLLPEVGEVQARASALSTMHAGGRIDDSSFCAPPDSDGLTAVYDPEGGFVALVSRERGIYRYELVAAPCRH